MAPTIGLLPYTMAHHLPSRHDVTNADFSAFSRMVESILSFIITAFSGAFRRPRGQDADTSANITQKAHHGRIRDGLLF